jgi:cell division protein ZapA
VLNTNLDDKTTGGGESKPATVEILGREYKIRGVADDAYVREVADYVDAKMREVSRATAAPVAERVAILAAMNIADELLQLRRASSEDMASIERRAQSLITMLDERLSAEA